MIFPLKILKRHCSLFLTAAVFSGCQIPTSLPSSELPPRGESQSIDAAAVGPLPEPPSIASKPPTVVPVTDLWERLRQGFQLQDHYDHPSVQAYIDNYSTNQRLFDLVTERASPFFFEIIQELEERGLPLELALLPIVESTFDPNAYSQQHAVGLWQFIGSTARSFGVQQDWWYDGRRDPVVSTAAALDYLTVLHSQFSENWLVAVGAYNTGDGNVRKAIRRSGQDMDALDFWSLPLATETRSHVPKLLALAATVNKGNTAGLELPPIANKPQLQLVNIGSQIDLAQAASLAGISQEVLRDLNPGYLQWATHPDQPQSLLVPIVNAQLLKESIAQADPDRFLTWDRYKIKSGDTLGHIAHRLNTRVDVLQQVNGIPESVIVAGDYLLIPRNINSASQLVNKGFGLEQKSALPNQPSFSSPPYNYRVRAGDNLWKIARKYDLKSSEIAQLNGIEMSSVLRLGQLLNLQLNTARNIGIGNEIPTEVSSALGRIHSVKRGDSIALIARRSGHHVSDLLNWNSLSKGEIIYPGQQIRLTPPESGTN
ncbi:MAG TPA: lytic transglycosylase [Gammaproteobacteria bacterium]|nr:lytic transglycosylase [Gammaproteobacteria bacterium]